MPIRRLDHISRTYHNMQASRIEAQRKRIASLSRTLALGRVVPEPADLAIGRGRRIEAAILFLDISGFTQRPANTADEQDMLVRVMSLFFSEMIRIVSEYGGTIEKNTGDGLMAYYARSSASSGDVRHRALASALTMFHAANYFINPIVARSNLEPIDFRIALDYGWITVARLGAAQRFNHIVAVGSTANRTCKMLAYADPNEILLGDAMLEGIPESWREAHLRLKTLDSGWFYEGTEVAYPFWSYQGRWLEPTR